jgi:hypothetical protein
MAQPRYNATLQAFIREWRPNDAELDKRFIQAVRELVSAIVSPPAGVFEVETILSDAGGKVILRLGDYEAQLDPLDAQRLALALVEAAAAARAESWLVQFLQQHLQVEMGTAARVISSFRDYRVAEMQRELDRDMQRPAPAAAPGGGKR